MGKKAMQVHDRDFTVVIEQDEGGYLVGSVPELPGCYTQAKTRPILMERIREAIELCLMETDEPVGKRNPFVGVARVKVKLPRVRSAPA